MPRNSGVYSLPSGNPFQSGEIASSAVVNNTLDDLGDEITNSVPRDGTASATANLPMGNFKHTSVANAAARNQYAAAGQVQDGALNILSTVAGTNTITGDLTPPITAYTAGLPIVFRPAATNTDVVTIAINGLAAVSIVKNDGDPLSASDLMANVPAYLTYSGTTFWLQNPQTQTPPLVWLTLIQNNAPFIRTQSEISAGVTPTNYAYFECNILRYGATWDRLTDNLAALNRAKSVCMHSRDVYIPPAPAGMFYRYSGTWLLDDLPDGATVRGEGIASLLLNANTSGASAIVVEGGLRVRLQNFAVCGVAGSGHGIELGVEGGSAAHHVQLIGMYSAWMDGACFKVTKAISVNFENPASDRNSGFRPFDFTGTGLTEGNPTHGLHIIGRNDGLNNNVSCTDPQFNAVGSVYTLQVGTNGVLPVQSFSMRGGLAQGAESFREIYLRTKDSYISCHIEPPVGATANFVVSFDGCVNTEIEDCVITGDVELIAACTNVRMTGVTGCGVDIATTCDRTVIEDFEYANIQTGPTGGALKDRGKFTTLRRIKNASNARFAVGDGLENPMWYYHTDMETWVGGGSPTGPCGLTVLGGTITRETSVVRTGTYSAKVVMSADLTQGFSVTLAPANTFVSRMIVVEAWVRNLTTAGLAHIGMVEGGTGAAVYQPSYQQDVWERILVTFVPDAAATSVTLRFTGNTGTVYWDDIRYAVENFTPRKVIDLDTVATPTVSYGGRPVPQLTVAASVTDITNFTEPHVGVPFDLLWTGNRTLKHNANIVLKSGGDTVGTAGTTRRLAYWSDGVFREV